MTDRAQDTGAIRAALKWACWADNALANRHAEKAVAALARLVARLEAAERERDEAREKCATARESAARNAEEARALGAALAAAHAALAAAAPGETEQTP